MNLLSPTDDDENPTFHIANAIKRMIPVNIKTHAGQEIVHKLISEADVFITSLRQEPLKKLGLDYDTLSPKHPGLIYAHVLGKVSNSPFDCSIAAFVVKIIFIINILGF